MKDYKERNNFILRTTFLSEMPCSHAKMCLKSAPQKLNFLTAKAISKNYALVTLDISQNFA